MHYYQLKPEIQNIFEETVSVFSFQDQSQQLMKDHVAFQDWLNANAHANMFYMEKNREIRENPTHLLKDSKTAIIFLFPYAYGKRIRNRLKLTAIENSVRLTSVIGKKLISKYVYGKDYHKVIKKRLTKAAAQLSEVLEIEFSFKPVVDSVPFFDRGHAQNAGLGFIGKNTMLIRPGMGSFFFIGTLLTTIPIDLIAQKKIKPVHLDCGECRLCIDACPTQAIEKEYFLNANKCLSYLTIEHRGPLDEKYIPHFANTIYGCDICQDVCPYNLVTLNSPMQSEFAQYHKPFTELEVEDIAQMTMQKYQSWFGGTAATRAKYEGLIRNALTHLVAVKHENCLQILENLVNSPNLAVKNIAQILLKFSQMQSDSK